MAVLGSSTIGFTFTISGSFGDAAGGFYTVPSPGIFVSDINVYAGNNGSSSTDRLYVWKDAAGIPGAWLLRSGTFAMGGTRAWQTRSDISANTGQITSDGYLPAGTKIWIGIFASTGILAYEGAGSGTTELGNTADGDWNDHGPAGGGFGVLGAYVDYTVLAVPTLSNASPGVGAAGTAVTLTGTHLLHATGVTVCGVAASFSATSDTSIGLTVPSGASGAGNIVVTTPAGSASIAFIAGQIYSSHTAGAPSSLIGVYGSHTAGAPVTILGVYRGPAGGGAPVRIW